MRFFSPIVNNLRKKNIFDTIYYMNVPDQIKSLVRKIYSL